MCRSCDKWLKEDVLLKEMACFKFLKIFESFQITEMNAKKTKLSNFNNFFSFLRLVTFNGRPTKLLVIFMLYKKKLQ